VVIAVIDIGTNTVLLLVATVGPAGQLETLEFQQRVPRLGRGVDERKTLHPDSMQRVIDVLVEYRTIAAKYSPEVVAVCGTSAVRDAANREEFAALIQREVGFSLDVLTGEEEALWTYRGALSGISDISHATVVDIGGGSTELTTGTVHEILATTSLDIGSVRLTERLMRHDPPLDAELAAVRRAVASSLATIPSSLVRNPVRLVGVAGTVTTLALLAQQKRSFDLQAVSGHIVQRAAVSALVMRLQQLSSAEILEMGNYLEGRNDVITAGAIILEEVMAVLGAEEITVSERGVRYGIAIREWEKKGENSG
jgi:exopolyphosphatase/guanosine-5'-triphosphate,3'-diphosphate pyrophosphatase